MNSKVQAVITLSNNYNTRVIRLGLILSENTRTRLVQHFAQTRFKREFTKKEDKKVEILKFWADFFLILRTWKYWAVL